MSTRNPRDDERWSKVAAALLDRGLDGWSAARAADYVIECLDELEAELMGEREPHG